MNPIKNTFFELDTMTPKKGWIIEKNAVLNTTRALTIIDRRMYLVIGSAGTTDYFYSETMHRIHNSIYYHGHYIVKFMNNTNRWYCPYLHSIGYHPEHKNLDTILLAIDRLEQ